METESNWSQFIIMHYGACMESVQSSDHKLIQKQVERDLLDFKQNNVPQRYERIFQSLYANVHESIKAQAKAVFWTRLNAQAQTVCNPPPPPRPPPSPRKKSRSSSSRFQRVGTQRVKHYCGHDRDKYAGKRECGTCRRERNRIANFPLQPITYTHVSNNGKKQYEIVVANDPRPPEIQKFCHDMCATAAHPHTKKPSFDGKQNKKDESKMYISFEGETTARGLIKCTYLGDDTSEYTYFQDPNPNKV